MGGDPANKLLPKVVTVQRKILKAVSGQFLHNPNNRQVYLDLKKAENFDALTSRTVKANESLYEEEA